MSLRPHILALLVALSMAWFFSCTEEEPRPGLWKNAHAPENAPPGRWRYARAPEDQGVFGKGALKELDSLPYLQGHHSAPGSKGVTRYDKDKAQPGVNFVVSGHKAYACLMDMEGKVLHEWSLPYEKVWARAPEREEMEVHKTYWRRAHLFGNGDLIAIFEGYGIIKIDKDSRLIWKNDCRAHHDLFVTEDGFIYTLTRETVEPPPVIHIKGKIWDDHVTVLDRNGRIVKSFSLLDSFLESDHAPVLDYVRGNDIMHTNTIEILGKRADKVPSFERDWILLSMRKMNTIALVDPDEEKVVWSLSGLWKMQHDPTLLDNGNILVFDNLGWFGRSRIMEFHPLTQKMAWQFKDSREHKLYTLTCGAVQRLPNGNTLIAETDFGRALEVTPGGEIAWEWVSPHRAGEDDELIATLLDIKRLTKQEVDCGQGGCFP